MSSVTSQPKAINSFEYKNEFQLDFFDFCVDPKKALVAIVCFPFAVCQLHQHMGECFCTPCVCPLATCMLRSKLRSQYKIRGALWKDVVAISLCPLCAVLQMIGEIHMQGDI